MSAQTNQSASTTERGEKIVLLVLGGIGEGIVHTSEVTLSGEDFKDPSYFSGQTRKTEIQSGDFFFFFLLSCSVKLCCRGFHGKMNKTAWNADESCESAIKAALRHHGKGTDVPVFQTFPV